MHVEWVLIKISKGSLCSLRHKVGFTMATLVVKHLMLLLELMSSSTSLLFLIGAWSGHRAAYARYATHTPSCFPGVCLPNTMTDRRRLGNTFLILLCTSSTSIAFTDDCPARPLLWVDKLCCGGWNSCAAGCRRGVCQKSGNGTQTTGEERGRKTTQWNEGHKVCRER